MASPKFSPMASLKLGILSTARINERCVLQVTPRISGVSLLAVASRSEEAARDYSLKHAIPRFYGGYDALLADPDVDAVYIPLPNALHIEWTRRALSSGKHVLCEKPMSADASEVLAIRELAQSKNLYVAEAMHYRHHPVLRDVVSAIHGGVVGEVEELEVSFVWNLRNKGDIRLRPELDGGALMDVGCYCLNFIRWITRDQQPRVTEAHAEWSETGVDIALNATLFCSERTRASFHCDLSAEAFECWAKISGSRGSLLLRYPFLPVVLESQQGEEEILFSCKAEDGKELSIDVPARTSYFYQLQNFRDLVGSGHFAESDGPASRSLTDAFYNAALIAEIRDRVRKSGPVDNV